MTTPFNLKATLLTVVLLALPFAQAHAMGQADYRAAKSRISADHKADRAACESLAGNAEADAAQARTDADYKAAAEKCGALAGDAKDSCLAAAKARFGKR